MAGVEYLPGVEPDTPQILYGRAGAYFIGRFVGFGLDETEGQNFYREISGMKNNPDGRLVVTTSYMNGDQPPGVMMQVDPSAHREFETQEELDETLALALQGIVYVVSGRRVFPEIGEMIPTGEDEDAPVETSLDKVA